MNKIDKLWFLIPTGLLLLALFPLPYGYYQFLRITSSKKKVQIEPEL